MRRRRSPEIIAGRVNADGSIAAGDGFVVSKTGTGAYTVTLSPGFRLIAAMMTSNSGPNVGVVGSPAERSFVISTFGSSTATSVDSPWSFLAVGVQQ